MVLACFLYEIGKIRIAGGVDTGQPALLVLPKIVCNGVVGPQLSRLRLQFTRPVVCLRAPTRPRLGPLCLLGLVAFERIPT